MIRAARVAALLLAGSGFTFNAWAQDEALGAPQPDKTLRDPEFGVIARHLGLERHVEMLQWQSAPDNGYVKTWNEQPIDSSGFAPGHQNPGAFPLLSQRWLARTVSIDGKPLDQEVIRRLGEWRDFRPNFSALPGNLAATFQPEGNGLGSAENPLDPQVGDLRIRWRDLDLPMLDDKVALREGRWQFATIRPVPNLVAKPAGPVRRSRMLEAAPWLGALLMLLLGAFLIRRRR